MVDKPIEALINENFIYAKVLHFFGVEFYNSRSKTLKEVCDENNIDEAQLKAMLEKAESRRSPEYLELKDYPAILIIAYLKHAHQVFVKDKLPYLAKLISKLKPDHDKVIAHDLKMIFPLFVDDFVKHIHEEEDRLFSHIKILEKFLRTNKDRPKVQKMTDSFSIQKFALEHNHSDNEMKGIRGITNNYNTKEIEDIQLKVIFRELEAFDKELDVHANIENDILFPKALNLEKQVNYMLNSTLSLN